MPVGQVGANCESLWEKIIGKPYSGKPNVRFDEGELEIELLATTPALYSTESVNFFYRPAPKNLKRETPFSSSLKSSRRESLLVYQLSSDNP